MRYAEFRDRLQNALRGAGVFFHDAGAEETIDLADAVRRWEGRIRMTLPEPEPFHVSASLAFKWSPVTGARAYTCEEDLLTELLGRKQRYPKTQPRWTRVDLTLRGTLPYGSTTPMPDAQIFGPWTNSLSEKFDKLFTEFQERDGRIVAVTGAREEIRVKARSSPDGTLFLDGVTVSGFRLIHMPRVWDDPGRRRTEKDNDRALTDAATRFRAAIDEWNKSVANLARWIRYAPPPPDARPAEPWFEDDDESETIH